MVRKLLFLEWSGVGNLYDTHKSVIGVVAKGLQERGFDTQVLHSGEPDFFEKMMRICMKEEPAIMAGAFHYDTTISVAHLERPANLFVSMGLPLFASIVDQPFANFMLERMVRAAPQTRFRINDPGHIQAARLLNPELVTFDREKWFAFMPHLAPQPERAHEDRDIDLLVPLNLRKTRTTFPHLRREAVGFDPRAGHVVDEVFETLRDDSNARALDVFARAIEREAHISLWELPKDGPHFMLLIKLLSEIDICARMAKRFKLLAGLEKIAPEKKIVVTSPVPDGYQLAGNGNTDIRGFVTLEELAELQSRARWVLNVNPPFPDDLSTRVLNALSCGAAVMSDRNREIDRVFGEDGGLAYVATPEDIADLVNEATPAQTQAMAAKAWGLGKAAYSEEQYFEAATKLINTHAG